MYINALGHFDKLITWFVSFKVPLNYFKIVQNYLSLNLGDVIICGLTFLFLLLRTKACKYMVCVLKHEFNAHYGSFLTRSGCLFR